MLLVFQDLNEMADKARYRVVSGEEKTVDFGDYDSKTIRQQIVHTRQDVIMIYTMLNNIGQLLQEIVLMLYVFFGVFIVYLIYLAYSSFIA